MMKLFFKLRYVPALLFVLMSAPFAQAATTPSLGAAATYGVLSDTYSNPIGPTTINGDVGYTTAGGVTPLPLPRPSVTYPNYASGGNYSSAGTAQATALVSLNGWACDFTFVAPNVVLDTTLEHGTTYTPGVYCSTGTMAVGTAGGITLSGAGTYIFRSGGALDMVASATVNLTAGANACDVFWTPNGATTFNANSIFVGTVIPVSQDITVLSTVAWTGRALTFGHTVTTPNSNVTITVPTCAVPPTPSPTTTAAPNIHVTKIPSPLALPAGPGLVTYTYAVTNPGTITLTNVTLIDDKCTNMVFVNGDTNGNSQLEINETWNYTCSMNLPSTTVNFATARGLGNGMAAVDTAIAQVNVGIPVVPPLINIVKTLSPLTLPFGGGPVTYTYVVTNPGTVALNGVTVTDNRCSAVTMVSGDANGNLLMETNEAWTYTCSVNIPFTTINTAIATGHANGLTAIDTALATVLVAGSPVPPPLIHVIKAATPVILPSTGGVVNYTYSVSNPGLVTLNTVNVSDDRCGPVNFLGGDVNGNGLMEVGETWTYSCQQNLSASTINTATASGIGNDITVTDISAASVVLSAALIPPPPALPNTGVEPAASNAWALVLSGLFLVATLLLASTQWKKSSK